eukprot:m.171932 g.171932  ORF g.171932 m.171932 type:complete len:361 (+) comp15359_c0_seq8:201-1283(+)
MASARVTDALPPDVNPIKASLAFGNRAVPRLDRELQAKDLLTVQKSLYALCDALRNPKNISSSLETDITKTLQELLTQQDHVVRELATEALVHIAGHELGRTAIVNKKIMVNLVDLFSDQVIIVRKNTLAVFQRVSKTQDGSKQLVSEKLVSPLLEVVLKEANIEVKNRALETLHNVMKIDRATLLQEGAMDAFVSLVSKKDSDPETTRLASDNIMMLSVPLEGKQQACASGAVETLALVLSSVSRPLNVHTNTTHWYGVIASACGALTSIAITTDGKKRAVACGCLVELGPLLDIDDERVLLNAIKLISVLAEEPTGRKTLQPLVKRLTELKTFQGTRLDTAAVSRHATTAIDIIQWTP